MLTLVGVAAEAAATKLANKLEQRNAKHDRDTKDFRIQARKAEGLEAEVGRLKEEVPRAGEEVELEKEKVGEVVAVVLEEAKTMSAEYEKKIQDLKDKHQMEIEAREKEKLERAAEHLKRVEG
jgi:ketopantoate reductase